MPVLRCQKACGKLLNCALHVCEQTCHDGSCEECEFKIQQGKGIKSCCIVKCNAIHLIPEQLIEQRYVMEELIQ